MANPDDNASQEVSFTDRINNTVAQMTQDEKGNWQLPEGVEDEVLVTAVNLERRRRDTQSAYTKVAQENARLKAEAEQLAKGWQNDFASQLSPEVQAELEELKVTDPDAWRAKLNTLEQERTQKFNSTREEIRTKAQHESEADYRTRAMAEFSEKNPGIVLNDEVIANDVPPRYLKELEAGTITFGAFLDKCAEFIGKPRVLKQEEQAKGGIDLGKVPGGDAPSGDAVKAALTKQYDDEIF